MHSMVTACLSHSTIDHSSLPRRSTVPCSKYLGAHYVFSIYFIKLFRLPYLLPRRAIASSYCAKFLLVTCVCFPRLLLQPIPFILVHFACSPLSRVSTFFCVATQGHICASSSSSRLRGTGIPLLSGRPRSPTRICNLSVFA